MRLIGYALILATAVTAGAASAQTTPVSVYVISRGAKFVGSSMGGARVTVQDASTGEVLAQGVTAGGTGDTDLIMGARKRDQSGITDSAAGFETTLDLDAAIRVRITAHGPLDYPPSANTVSATQWLLPGEGTGDGLVLELPGLVTVMHDTPALVALENDEALVPVRAHVSMMCGCPLTPGGLWDSTRFRIHVRLLRDGVEIASAPLRYAGDASEFSGEIRISEPGAYELAVEAVQPHTGNAGRMQRTLVVQ